MSVELISEAELMAGCDTAWYNLNYSDKICTRCLILRTSRLLYHCITTTFHKQSFINNLFKKPNNKHPLISFQMRKVP